MKTLPLQIGKEILVCSKDDPNRKARVHVLGARQGDVILVEGRDLAATGIWGRVAGVSIICGYLHEGEVYRFTSKIIKRLPEELTVITYPTDFERRALRRYPRIKVNVAARFFHPTQEGLMENGATIADISEGGCHVFIHARLDLPLKSKCRLDFDLPDGQEIRGMTCLIRKAEILKTRLLTEAGLQFLAPVEMKEKISAFCRYCLCFKRNE